MPDFGCWWKYSQSNLYHPQGTGYTESIDRPCIWNFKIFKTEKFPGNTSLLKRLRLGHSKASALILLWKPESKGSGEAQRSLTTGSLPLSLFSVQLNYSPGKNYPNTYPHVPLSPQASTDGLDACLFHPQHPLLPTHPQGEASGQARLLGSPAIILLSFHGTGDFSGLSAIVSNPRILSLRVLQEGTSKSS